MALGKNLKKKQLIAPTPAKPKKKATAKKKVVSKKKELIKKPKAPVSEASEVKVEQKEQSINAGLPMFIAKEIFDKKKRLRKNYKEEIAQLEGKSIQFVVFKVGGESYAVSIDDVKEVVPIPALSKTPNTPSHIKGIANVRGNTYTVFDLATKFKIIGEEIPRYLMVINNQGVVASLMLSSLPTTFRISGDNISSSLQMIEDATLDVTYIKGLIKHDEQLIYFLDIVELLKSDKAIIVPENLKEE